jgi:RNA polymerase sigma-70 factor (ECF subfamily)
MTEERNVTATTSALNTPLDGAVRLKNAPSPGSDPAAPQPTRAESPGERARITALIEKDYVGLRLLIGRRAGDPQIAADLLNDAICTTWEKWQAGQIKQPEQIAGYVFQVAMNLLRNHRRSMGTRPEKRANVKELDALPAKGEARDQLAESQIAARVKKLIRDMGSERDRQVLVRFYLNEEEKDSICRDMKLNPLQFDKVLHRARRRLRELLESSGLQQSDLFSLLLVM